jgi:hypothetical protein
LEGAGAAFRLAPWARRRSTKASIRIPFLAAMPTPLTAPTKRPASVDSRPQPERHGWEPTKLKKDSAFEQKAAWPTLYK